jgi:hypothetical protein
VGVCQPANVLLNCCNESGRMLPKSVSVSGQTYNNFFPTHTLGEPIVSRVVDVEGRKVTLVRVGLV